MLAVALGALAAGALILCGLTAALAFLRDRWQQRAFDRKEQAWTQERGILLDRLADLAGRPWTVSPRETPTAPLRPPLTKQKAAEAEIASRW